MVGLLGGGLLKDQKPAFDGPEASLAASELLLCSLQSDRMAAMAPTRVRRLAAQPAHLCNGYACNGYHCRLGRHSRPCLLSHGCHANQLHGPPLRDYAVCGRVDVSRLSICFVPRISRPRAL